MAELDVFFSEFGVVTGGGLKHEPGAVHAYFRNGKFMNIVRQGKFAVPVLRRTLIGHIEVIAISTATHEVAVEVRDVMTADDFMHPLVVVRLQLCLNDEQGYRRVASLLTQQGRQAGAYLGAGLGAIVQQQVRQGFGERTSDELLRNDPAQLVRISLDQLADGVVLVRQVTAIEWVRSAAVDKMLETAAHAATLELTHEVERIETRHTVELGRIVADDHEITLQREHARQRELATLDALKEIASGYFASGRATNKDFKEVMGALGPVGAGQLAPPTWSAPPLPGGEPRPAIESSAATVEHDRADLPALHVDARLRRIWTELSLPAGIAGCASSSSGAVVGAVFVLHDAAVELFTIEQLRALEHRLMESYKAEVARVILLPLLGTRLTLVQNYLAAATRHVGTIVDRPIVDQFAAEIEDGEDFVRFAISGPQAAEVRRVLSDPAMCLLSPLAMLLALDYVEAVLVA